ncbi:DUF3168 domain-containing protein [uncultured Brevundimonas sp.]|uniref:DUF3168 domain-containing protein n=1 Tax=uncultured Brevundimonas sp. TaxID=213418 RepID=UPI0030EB63D6|tara:strand:- start:53365 stop:53772 length:408 start_codon:yes stop_codon:yes gene_type:complete
MSDHESALQAALIAHLTADATLSALLNGRVWDAPPRDAGFPHLLIGRSASRPVAAEGCGIEHRLSLTVISRFQGTEEVRAIVAAVRARLEGAALESGGIRTVSLGVTLADVFRGGDGARTWAVIRVRAVTEDIAG